VVKKNEVESMSESGQAEQRLIIERDKHGWVNHCKYKDGDEWRAE
jgi:hypothetical protein